MLDTPHMTEEISRELLTIWWASLSDECKEIITKACHHDDEYWGIPVYSILQYHCQCEDCKEQRRAAEQPYRDQLALLPDSYTSWQERETLLREMYQASRPIGQVPSPYQVGIIPVIGSLGTRFELDVGRASGSIRYCLNGRLRVGCAAPQNAQYFIEHAMTVKRWLELDERHVIRKANW